MGKVGTRTGTPTIATVDTAGTPGGEDTPALRSFAIPNVRPCLVTNNTGNGSVIRVKINNATDFDGDGDDDGGGHLVVADGTTVDISYDGLINVKQVGIYCDGADLFANVYVVGWGA